MAYIIDNGNKKCPYCGLTKPVEAFYTHSTMGIQGYCKECKFDYQVRYRYKKKLLNEYVELQNRIKEIELKLGIA